MYTENSKTYFEHTDFEIAVTDIVKQISMYKDVHIVAPYRGALPLGVRLSNQCNVPLSILDYQRLDGNSQDITMMKNANIQPNQIIYLVEDIIDKGITINKCLKYLSVHFPKNTIKVYSIYGNKKHNPEWSFTFKHTGNWVVFEPWEGR